MNVFEFTIVTPNEVIHEGAVEQVTVPTQDGEITILANHTPLVSLLKPGELRVTKSFEEGAAEKSREEIPMAVSFGFVEVRQSGEVVILADTAEHAEKIDIERAQAARKRAEELLQEKQREEEVDYARFQAMLDKELARIKVGEKYAQ